jgi:hypothetical protein
MNGFLLKPLIVCVLTGSTVTLAQPPSDYFPPRRGTDGLPRLRNRRLATCPM